jgi:hypothetical protein
MLRTTGGVEQLEKRAADASRSTGKTRQISAGCHRRARPRAAVLDLFALISSFRASGGDKSSRDTVHWNWNFTSPVKIHARWPSAQNEIVGHFDSQ